MNFRDYQRIMTEKNLVTNPIAETYLADAVVCARNIKTAQGNAELIAEYEKRKDWYIEKAIEESWGADEMDYPSYWKKSCLEIRENLIAGGVTKEIQLTGGKQHD